MSHAVLGVSANHPDQFAPYRCIFNERSFRSISNGDVSTVVVSPRPFAPPIGPYSEMRSLPTVQQWENYELHHPRFFYGLPKKLFYPLAGRSFRKRVTSYIESNLQAPDIVQAHHLYIDGWAMTDYAQTHDVPLIVVSHGMLNQYDNFTSPVQHRLRTVLREADYVASVSEDLAQTARALVPETNAGVVPIGADPSRFQQYDPESVREELGIDSSTPIVLFCGQLIRRKGIDVLVEALRAVDAPDFEMIFVTNSDELKQQVTTLAAEATGHNVRIYEEISDERLGKIFKAADLLVLPSRREGRPTVIYEAMASNTAVLSTKVGGIPEQVVDGETGVLLDTLSRETLEEELGQRLRNLASTREMGDRGYERLLEQEWTWEGHGKRMRSIQKQFL
jgi:glycosyltransferase involved in cell wall biosynthesis